MNFEKLILKPIRKAQGYEKLRESKPPKEDIKRQQNEKKSLPKAQWPKGWIHLSKK